MPSDKPEQQTCGHPSFRQERLKGIGSGTGDYLCERCGALFTLYEVQQIEAERKGKSN